MLKRNIKANHKDREFVRLPFIVASIPEKPNNKLQVNYTKHKIEMMSHSEIRCHGDTDVLRMMGLGECYAQDDLQRLLGPEFAELPAVFARCQTVLQ